MEVSATGPIVIIVEDEDESEVEESETEDDEEYIYCPADRVEVKQICGAHQEQGCIAGPKGYISSSSINGPVIDTEVMTDDLSDVSEYGFGFWM
jgi:uncharacterized protein with PIN domain